MVAVRTSCTQSKARGHRSPTEGAHAVTADFRKTVLPTLLVLAAVVTTATPLEHTGPSHNGPALSMQPDQLAAEFTAGAFGAAHTSSLRASAIPWRADLLGESTVEPVTSVPAGAS